MALPIDLGGRVFLVCGVARGGIGGATARRIAAAGGTVVGVDQTQEILDATIADIEAASGKCHGAEVSALTEPTLTSDPGTLRAIIEAAASRQMRNTYSRLRLSVSRN